MRCSCLPLLQRGPRTTSLPHLVLRRFSVCRWKTVEHTGEAAREEKKRAISQQRGTDSWHRYKCPSPTVPRSSRLTTLSTLFKHLLNEPVTVFILTRYLRVKSSAELRKCEWWRKLFAVETLNWITQLENLFEFLVRHPQWLKHQREWEVGKQSPA